MALLKDEDKREIRKRLAGLTGEVKLVLFTQEHECQYCAMTREMVTEVAGLFEKIQVEVLDFVADADRAHELGIDKVPAVAVLGERDYGIRFYGVPAGYEFATFLEAMLDVSRGDPGLPEEWKTRLEQIDRPVHLQVMVTPTCPYCGQAVRTAHRFAMANEQIRGDMVEISEFPQLAVKYQVQGVPKTVINETHSLVGAQPEGNVLDEITKAISS